MIKNSVAITGHRPHKLPWGQDEESPLCEVFKATLLVRLLMLIDQGYDTFYTGMSWGVDLIFGELIVHLKKKHPNIKLIGVLPFEEMHAKWHVSYQERYFDLVQACDEVVLLNERYHDQCYKQRNAYLVEHASVLIAVYDNKSRRSGTLQTINMAKKKGRTITFINPITLEPSTLKGHPTITLIK